MLDIFLDLFQGLLIIKTGFLIVIALYVIFSLVVFKQAYAMQHVVNDKGASDLVNAVALINVLFGIFLFVAALVIL